MFTLKNKKIYYNCIIKKVIIEIFISIVYCYNVDNNIYNLICSNNITLNIIVTKNN